ncbi:MAG: DoxX family protein [Pseudomonadota bacterium]|nr:DoxX family protein [Pseudomonadota bacterium]
MRFPTTKFWNIALWVTQIYLCGMFLFAGVMKVAKSPQGLADMGWHWALVTPHWFILFIGVMEIAGAIGVVLPGLTRILPVLVPTAAGGMILVQIAAIILHATRGETSHTLPINLILLVPAAFVVWGRTRPSLR